MPPARSPCSTTVSATAWRGFLTITGGKWTTFRLMAETDHGHRMPATRCHAALSHGDTRRCLGVDQGHYWLGHRLHEVEEHRLQPELVCECELVTRAMLEHAVRRNPTITLDDLRRDVRLGMGPCQGGFCTYRAVGITHELIHRDGADHAPDESEAWDVAYMQSPGHMATRAGTRNGPSKRRPAHLLNPNLLLNDFLQERWKGLTPVLWGQQLKQERLDELIYLHLMNVDHLPPDDAHSPLTDFYRFDTTPGGTDESSGGSASADKSRKADADA